jgi:SAM-dependent methyltransferase
MHMATYQSHDLDSPGISNSSAKLRRLNLPEDLKGKRVLDIGCAEGYFCNVVSMRGADSVTGIDVNRASLEFARNRYGSGNVDFSERSWDRLPDGKFDLVIWTSAMHYEKNPRMVLDSIHDRLSDDGLLVLECGVINEFGSQMVPVNRYSDTTYYPTVGFLKDMLLANFSSRGIGPPETTDGDPIPRSVYHCRKIKPTVVLINGSAGDGKTFLTDRYLSQVSTKHIHLDELITRIGRSEYQHREVQRLIRKLYDPADLSKAYRGLENQEMSREFAGMLADLVSASDRFVVIEGMIIPELRQSLLERMASDYFVWDMSRAG